jgi:hypothetical protein
LLVFLSPFFCPSFPILPRSLSELTLLLLNVEEGLKVWLRIRFAFAASKEEVLMKYKEGLLAIIIT